MNKTTYNGWSNWATWTINLNLYDEVAEMAIENEDQFEDAYDAGQFIKHHAEELIATLEDAHSIKITNLPLIGEAVHGFMDDVNWSELGQHLYELMITEAKERGWNDEEEDDEEGEGFMEEADRKYEAQNEK